MDRQQRPDQDSDRLYLGNLPRDTSKQDLEDFFGAEEMANNIVDIKLLGVYGFAQCKNAQVAMELIPRLHGKMLKNQRISVQMARGARVNRGDGPYPTPGGSRRTQWRMVITGLPETSWQDLKDFARRARVEVVFSEVGRPGEGIGFVEFNSEDALHEAVRRLDNTDYPIKGDETRTRRVTCKIDTNHALPPPRGRSRSPPRYPGHRSPRGYSPRGYGRRGYSPPPPPHHHRYRERTPPSRDPYYRERLPERPLSPRGRSYRDDYPPPLPRDARDDYPPPKRDYDRGYDRERERGYPPRALSPRRSPPRDYRRRDDYGYDRDRR